MLLLIIVAAAGTAADTSAARVAHVKPGRHALQGFRYPAAGPQRREVRAAHPLWRKQPLGDRPDERRLRRLLYHIFVGMRYLRLGEFRRLHR